MGARLHGAFVSATAGRRAETIVGVGAKPFACGSPQRVITKVLVDEPAGRVLVAAADFNRAAGRRAEPTAAQPLVRDPPHRGWNDADRVDDDYTAAGHRVASLVGF